MEPMSECDSMEKNDGDNSKNEKMFTLKKWNAVAMWSWDVECDTCAICRVQVMGKSNFYPIRKFTNKKSNNTQSPGYNTLNMHCISIYNMSMVS